LLFILYHIGVYTSNLYKIIYIWYNIKNNYKTKEVRKYGQD